MSTKKQRATSKRTERIETPDKKKKKKKQLPLNRAQSRSMMSISVLKSISCPKKNRLTPIIVKLLKEPTLLIQIYNHQFLHSMPSRAYMV